MFPQTTKFNDMFPHTGDIHAVVSGHVETVVLLSKLKSDKHIDVELDMEDELSPDSYPANIFKNSTKCKQLEEKVNIVVHN